MAIKKYKPTSPGRRAGSVLDYKTLLTKFKPEKSLCVGQIRGSGRNHHGKITSQGRGGGNKRLYRLIDFKRLKDNMPAAVLAIEYDPFRTCHIALIQYQDGTKSYILGPLGLKVGQTVVSGTNAPPEIGNCMPLANVPSGMEIHNIEMNPGQGGKLCRSAGNVARLGAKEGEWSVIILPSGEMRRVRSACRATIGQIGNLDHQNIRLGKAGKAELTMAEIDPKLERTMPRDNLWAGGRSLRSRMTQEREPGAYAVLGASRPPVLARYRNDRIPAKPSEFKRPYEKARKAISRIYRAEMARRKG